MHLPQYEKPRLSPIEKTAKIFPFQIVGTDYARPVYYKSKENILQTRSKTYILLFSSSVSRAVHWEVVPNLTSTQFVKCWERLISRKGWPKVNYSEPKWLSKLKRDEQIHVFLSKEKTTWKFNLSRHRGGKDN